jgi:AraC-like DNA-binding protein
LWSKEVLVIFRQRLGCECSERDATMIKDFAGLPTVQGVLTRLAADRVRKSGIKLEPLLGRVGLTVDQIDNPEQRITARKQVTFLEAAAEALKDDFLGFSLAEEFNCRDTGLMYYVMASSDTLGDALKRASRYSRIDNEAIVIRYREGPEPTLSLTYSGIPRHTDRQQIEFFIGALVRLSRLLTGRQFFPKRASMVHVRSKGVAKFSRLLGDDIEFGSDSDEISFPDGSAEWTLVDADQHLNRVLLKFCDESINARKSNPDTLRVKVENTISTLLPHGHAQVEIVAKKLGMSERTLTRRLAEEGVPFNEVLQQLKASLATRYLEEDGMPISRIAWLLGFEEASSFSHACRRWTGKSPRELRRSN